jgi:predicted chitinase
MPSENGWEPAWVGQEALNWVDIPGCDVRVQIQKGLPTWLLRAWIADYNAFIEPVRDRDTASYTPTNSVSTSNHLNGTAADINWDSHPFHKKGTFTRQQMDTLREMQRFYTHQGVLMIFWAGDWASPIDEMHHQLGYSTYANRDIVADFVRTKIRPDGYSTFRRGNHAPVRSAADTLASATGLSLDRAAAILPAVQGGLLASECNNVNRIAMWLAQIGHESGGFQYTEEIASGAAYEGRLDLGNTKPGDGTLFKGRSWIQITGRNNYGLFSGWAARVGLVSSPTFFLDYPQKLSELQWAGVGAAWYWTIARSNINSKADQGDLLAVTKLINGGTNGIHDRERRLKLANGLGNELLTLVRGATPTDEEEELMAIRVKSLSIYAPPGEPDIALADLIRSIDAHGSHEEYVERQARLGDRDSIQRIARTAAGLGQYGDDPRAIRQASAVLRDLETNYQSVLTDYLKGNA